MDKTAMDCNETVQKLMDSELGLLLLQEDGNPLYRILAENGTWEDRMGMFGNDCHITYHLFPLLYNKGGEDTKADLAKSRIHAIQNVFKRWTAAGYNKRHAKSPFGCKAFQSMLDEVLQADYLLLLVD